MLKRSGIRTTIFLLATLCFWGSCTLDDPGPSNVTYPLTLEVQKNLSLIELNWSQVNVTGFKEYIILQSTTEIPSSSTPQVSSTVSILKRIDDADITTFNASEVLFAPRICYKLYASLADRFIQSANVCVDQDIRVFDGFYDRAAHESGLDEIVMYDRVNSRLSAYNYKLDEITKTEPNIFMNFPIMEISTWSGTTNMYAYDQAPATLRKYSFPAFTSNTSRVFANVLWAVKPFGQFLIASIEIGNGSFRVLNRSTLSDIDAKNGFLGNRSIGVFPGTPVIVLETGDNGTTRYTIDDAGKITFLDQKPGISQPSIQSSTAQGDEIFITGRFGSIIDRNGVIQSNLVQNINSTMLMARLSPDQKKVAYISNDNINITLDVADISNVQSPQLIESFEIPSANYSDVIIDSDIIYIIGVSFASGQAETFILKYPMP